LFAIKINTVFSAAHNLVDYNGACENCHGHNWRVQLTVVKDELGYDGMVMDFTVAQEILNRFVDKLDHKYLNELKFFEDINPTSERVAYLIYENILEKIERDGLKITEIEVWENEDSSACYIP